MTSAPTFEAVRSLVLRAGHRWFDSAARPLNLNIVGIRGRDAELDEFGCHLMVAWPEKSGRWQHVVWPITTWPGSRYLRDRLLNPAGCAILAPGQYRGCYGVAQHRGQYSALCQVGGAVTVFRDRNRDARFDLEPGTRMTGWFGINIHRSVSSGRALRVGAHSAGCQVFQSAKDFAEFMRLVTQSRAYWGNKFTYTLVDGPIR